MSLILILLFLTSPVYADKITEDSTLLHKEIDEHPENAEAQYLLWRTYLVQGNEVKALEFYDKAASMDKSYQEKMLSDYYEAGLILLKDSKKSNIGLHYLNRYLIDRKERSMEVADILHHEGLNMIVFNRYMAHVMLERARELNPSFGENEDFYFAYSVRSMHKSADIIKGGEDLLSRFPKGVHAAEALYLRGEAAVDLRKPQDARKYFRRVATEFPDTEWGKKAAAKN